MTESTALSKCFARQGVPIHIRKDWCQPFPVGNGEAATADADGEAAAGLAAAAAATGETAGTMIDSVARYGGVEGDSRVRSGSLDK
ncbi:hypothetical protein HDU86_005286 [Geranomyces michiganensis]|nr:hypothetical protein HDU86_005286 [Geranomyces michiganensis]